MWWVSLGTIAGVRFALLGLPEMKGYENYGIIFWIMATLFTALIFGSFPYFIYRLINGKWNNNVYMICISVTTIILLIVS